MESNISVNLENEILKIELSGHLDAKNAPSLSEKLKEMIGKSIKEIVFDVRKLEYISSAGLRVLIFSKQKLGEDVNIIMIGVQEAVLEVIKMSGLESIIEFKE